MNAQKHRPLFLDESISSAEVEAPYKFYHQDVCKMKMRRLTNFNFRSSSCYQIPQLNLVGRRIIKYVHEDASHTISFTSNGYFNKNCFRQILTLPLYLRSFLMTPRKSKFCHEQTSISPKPAVSLRNKITPLITLLFYNLESHDWGAPLSIG